MCVGCLCDVCVVCVHVYMCACVSMHMCVRCVQEKMAYMRLFPWLLQIVVPRPTTGEGGRS